MKISNAEFGAWCMSNKSLRQFQILLLAMILLAGMVSSCAGSDQDRKGKPSISGSSGGSPVPTVSVSPDPSGSPLPPAAVEASAPNIEGPYAFKQFIIEPEVVKNADYESVMVYFPVADRAAGPFPTVSMTGGFSNTKEDMAWLASHLVTHGFIVITVTPMGRLTVNPRYWSDAHIRALALLKEQNAMPAGPLEGRVDFKRFGLVGFSMGGAGSILAANLLDTEVKTVVALCPFVASLKDLSPTYLKGSLLAIAGESDWLAPPKEIVEFYNRVQEVDKVFLSVTNMKHSAITHDENGSFNLVKRYVTAWLKGYLENGQQMNAYFSSDEAFLLDVEAGVFVDHKLDFKN
jgi:dienelactone hydrolase